MGTSALPKFELLNFGQIDAALEAQEMPDLLVSGYYDYNQAVQHILDGRTWLILGPKGSGKSAVLEHIRLRWKTEWNRFYTGWDLAGFPVNDVTRMAMGQTAGSSRNQAAWEFLLLLRVVESLASDEGMHVDAKFYGIVKNLRTKGLLSSDWSGSVAAWSSSSFKLDLKIFSTETRVDVASITPLEANAYLWQMIEWCQTESRHVIALDGLDSFFFEQADEWTSLAGLMQATLALNRKMKDQGLPVSVVIAARSDVVDVLPGPEINRLKSHAVYLDWHANGIGSRNHLWELLSTKARVVHPEVTNIVAQYLNRRVSIGPHTELTEYLLDHTRLLPRDAVALMRYLQRNYRGNGKVPEENAKVAVRAYCEEYFVGEIFDNLAGVLPLSRARHVEAFKDALRTSPSRYFSFEFVCDEVKGELEPVEVKQLLKQMFEIGGIGVRNGKFVDFVYRRVGGAGFTTRHGFMLHDALTRAWNRPWGRQDL
ncbi:hypothetical protein ASF62_10935 [Leifsonia sp. Leaf325]|nr:hypothetical protein [Leifsonia sp. Leaf325]KQQ94576.1 hypothetical protein ASF62_10935 [Leifsonia sp. Leaf325]